MAAIFPYLIQIAVSSRPGNYCTSKWLKLNTHCLQQKMYPKKFNFVNVIIYDIGIEKD